MTFRTFLGLEKSLGLGGTVVWEQGNMFILRSALGTDQVAKDM